MEIGNAAIKNSNPDPSVAGYSGFVGNTNRAGLVRDQKMTSDFFERL